MSNFKRYKGILYLLVCSIFLFTLLSIYNSWKQSQNESKQHNKVGFLYKSDITSFMLSNIKGEKKEIKNKSERNEIIDLINSVNITKSGVKPPIGCGNSVIITYSNGDKFSAEFTSTYESAYMAYSIDDIWITCKTDKDIFDDLMNYYNNN